MSVNDNNGANSVMKFKRTAEAENDLLSIWRYIAEDNQQAATRLILSIDKKMWASGQESKAWCSKARYCAGSALFNGRKLPYFVP